VRNNNDFHFEDIKIGIETAINRIQKDYHNHISSTQTTFNSIKDAKLKTLVTYKVLNFLPVSMKLVPILFRSKFFYFFSTRIGFKIVSKITIPILDVETYGLPKGYEES
jgi:hypothetical protein